MGLQLPVNSHQVCDKEDCFVSIATSILLKQDVLKKVLRNYEIDLFTQKCRKKGKFSF